MKNNSKIFKTITGVLGIMLLLVICIAAFLFAYTFSLSGWKKFDPHTLTDMDESLILYDSAGVEYLALDGGENRRVIDISVIPEHVKNAFIAIEDQRFYEHNGIDIVRIFGALINDIKSGSFKEGASTISQQLVKTAALSSDKTVTRKLSEIMMAFKTEQIYEKEDILCMYLNMVYFGNGAYGIEAASLTYFDKHAWELSIGEAACLAGILKSPGKYAPHINETECAKRRNTVLKRMFEADFISEKEYTAAINKPVNGSARNTDYLYGYYTDAVLDEAADILGISMSELLTGGYRIFTALDTDKQQHIEQISKDDALFPSAASDGEKTEAAIVLLSAENAEIAAMTGGREHTARLSFSRATDMKRQPGSAIKPVLVFAPAIEYLSYTPTSFLLDQPIRFGEYSPRNSGSSFKGWITLRDTVAYSVNIPAVSMLDELGVEKAKKYCSSVGIGFNDKDNNLSLALGGFTDGITPLELASSYQPFANGGYYSSPTTVRRIESSDGQVLYSSDTRAVYSVLSEETCFIMTSMLQSSVDYGTAKKLDTGIPLAAKTGTTTYDDAVNNKDAWITAYNSEYILSVWTGFDKTDPIHSLKKGETGGSFPAEIAKNIFSAIYKDKSAPEFDIPEGIVSVTLDSEALHNTFETVPAMSESKNSIVEYYTKDTAPLAFENDDIGITNKKFIYNSIE